MSDPDLKILYVVGYPHSGTTILGNLLGELDGFFHAGEIRYLWERNLLMRRRRCGCGDTVDRCEVWSAVLRETEGTRAIGPTNLKLADGSAINPVPMDPARVVRWQREAVRSHHLWRLLRQRPGRPCGWLPLDGYVEVMGRLYAALARVTGARVLVDTSKWPADAAVLRLVPGVAASFVHLIRDPRGIVFSRQRKKASFRRDGRLQPHRPLMLYDMAGWVGLNLAAEALCRRAEGPSWLVSYEDFVRNPGTTIRTIAQLVGEEPQHLPLLEDRVARLGPNHTLGGNRNRFATGTVELREDEGWRRGLRASDRLITTALLLPLLHRYGYPMTGARGGVA